MSECCANCRFAKMETRSEYIGTPLDPPGAEKYREVTEWFCRRNPPLVYGDVRGGMGRGSGTFQTSPRTAFPVISRHDWCGEFRPELKEEMGG